MDIGVPIKLLNMLGVVVVTLFLVSVPSVHSETVTCNADQNLDNFCLTAVNNPNAVITRIAEETPGFNCVHGKNYAYVYYGSRSYVYVLFGCGGTFRVTLPSTEAQWSQWGDWSACSNKCGTGTRTRVRICSTGVNSDCSANPNDSNLTGTCSSFENCVNTAASWNAWGNWGSCSVSCGGGTQARIRTCSTNVNTDCSANVNANMESRACNAVVCNSGTGTGTTGGTNNNPSCGKSPLTFGYRIIGGTEATKCQYPWMVMIYNSRKGTACGGSIIDSRHVLTAAHCVVIKSYFGQVSQVSASDLRIYSGSSEAPFQHAQSSIPGSVRRYASAVKMHQSYDDESVENDIAIITLSEPITFDRCHVPVCIPSSQQTPNTGCKVMGWGTTSNSRYARVSANLLHTDVSVVSPSTCYRYFGTNFNGILKLCVGGSGSGSCSGDSGGPLVCQGTGGQYYQFGIVSSGAYRQCGTLPSMYTKVTSFLPWIKANTV